MIDSQLDNGILTLTLNRPDKLNALNDAVLTALSEQFSRAKDDDEVKAVLITGSGRAFCAGADINRLAEANAETGYQFARQGQAVFRQLETLGKPSVAAVNGYAFGGGCELAMAATLRIASEFAQFGQPEIKLGVIPGYGGTKRLSRLIGKGRALEMCLTGRFIRGEEALQYGLINRLVDGDSLLSEARGCLESMMAMAPLAVRATMEVIDGGLEMSLDEAMQFEALHFAKLCATADKNEGVSAFLEKRPATFTGV